MDAFIVGIITLCATYAVGGSIAECYTNAFLAVCSVHLNGIRRELTKR